MSARKIIAGLRDAIAGRIAKATVYREGKPSQRYTKCEGCSGMTITVRGRCDLCGDRKIADLDEPVAYPEKAP